MLRAVLVYNDTEHRESESGQSQEQHFHICLPVSEMGQHILKAHIYRMNFCVIIYKTAVCISLRTNGFTNDLHRSSLCLCSMSEAHSVLFCIFWQCTKYGCLSKYMRVTSEQFKRGCVCVCVCVCVLKTVTGHGKQLSTNQGCCLSLPH